MSPFTSGAAPEPSNHHRKPLGKSAHRNRGTETRPPMGIPPRVMKKNFADLSAARLHIVKFFARIEYIAEKIDEAFVGQPFLPHMRADAPANRRRFNAYLEQHRQVTKLLFKALELWRLSFRPTIVTESKPPARGKEGQRTYKKVMSRMATGLRAGNPHLTFSFIPGAGDHSMWERFCETKPLSCLF